MAGKLLGSVIIDLRPKLVERMRAEGRFTDEQRRRFGSWKDMWHEALKDPAGCPKEKVGPDPARHFKRKSEPGSAHGDEGKFPSVMSRSAERVLNGNVGFHNSLLHLLHQGSSANLMEVAIHCSNDEGNDPFNVMRAAASLVRKRIRVDGNAAYRVDGESFEYTRGDMEGLLRLDRDAVSLSVFLDSVIKG